MIAIDLDDLVDAMEDASEKLNYFFDRETGEVVLVSDTLGFIEAGYQRIEMAKSRGRYEPVPVSAASDFSSDLETFIDGLDDESLAEELEKALDALVPRKRVDDLLEEHPKVAESWNVFRKERAKERAIAWMKAIGISGHTSG